MTHPTDDEIMELAGAWFHTGENQKRDDGYYYRSLGTPSNVRGSDLIEFARALLAEQARTEPHKAEDAPSDELQRFNEAQERTDFEAHLKAELKAHWIYNNPNGHDLVDMMVSVIPDEINGHKQTNAGRYVDKGVETQWHGWRARDECAAIAQERKA